MGNRTGRLTAVAAFAAGVVLAGSAGAQAGGDGPLGGALPAKAGPGSPRAEMDSAVAGAAAGRSAASRMRAEGLRPSGGVITVELRAPGGAAGLVRRLGGKVLAAAGGAIEARVPVDALERLASARAVRRIAALDPGVPEAVAGGEVAMTGAAEAHAAGITGAGVGVMVLDAGFAGLEAAQAAGEVPAQVAERNFCPSFSAGGEHGTQVAQIVHEMAPGAALHLVCANSTADLREAVEYAAASGIRIISRSIGVFNSSRGDGSGGTGSPDAVVDLAAAHGILWINSAGNYARNHWGGPWSDDGASNLEWAPGDSTNSLVIPRDDTQCLYLKWDDWPGSSVDLDLSLRASGGAVDLAASNDLQDGTTPPTERLCVENKGPTAAFDIVVRQFVPPGETRPEVPRVDLFVPDTSSIEHAVATTSLNDLAGHPGVLATTAVCSASGVIQPYSSQGPTIAGALKPDLAAPTPVSTSTLTVNGCSGGFSGTSATAPQVAGAAALFAEALQRSGTGLRGPIEALASSHDLGFPGRDTVYGAGQLQVELTCGGRAVTLLGTPGADSIAGGDGPDVIQGLGGRDRLAGLGGRDLICGGAGRDKLSGGTGRDRLRGGPGRDRLRGGEGRDRLRGGPGRDSKRQ